ncbi:hypothetical protein CDFC105_93890 [Clostridioides difficile]|nr:hypothetical protein CDFC105_93890 [Clostridioides difficile]
MVIVFFFKQKTAYEISACLVGSEMCIRDRYTYILPHKLLRQYIAHYTISIPDTSIKENLTLIPDASGCMICLLYTSDAADEEDSGDLGGHRSTKEQKHLYLIHS